MGARTKRLAIAVLLAAGVVTVFPAFSCMVKPVMVTQSAPTSLKMASVKTPAVWGVNAVIVLPLPWIVIVLVELWLVFPRLSVTLAQRAWLPAVTLCQSKTPGPVEVPMGVAPS